MISTVAFVFVLPTQVWSNGMLKAPEHRVRPTMELHRVRYSAPFFYNPNYDAIVTPLPGICRGSAETTLAPSGETGSVQQPTHRVGKALYSSIRWGDYRNMRFQGDFKDVGEEVQIEHFQAQA
jgi:hypothetical protein